MGKYLARNHVYTSYEDLVCYTYDASFVNASIKKDLPEIAVLPASTGERIKSERTTQRDYKEYSWSCFPEKGMTARLDQIKGWMSIELSAGQMVDDVKLVINGQAPVHFYGRQGGMTPEPEQVMAAFKVQFLGGEQV